MYEAILEIEAIRVVQQIIAEQISIITHIVVESIEVKA